MEIAVFSFVEASCFVVVHIFTSSTLVQSTGPVIVTRFFFHMCVFFRGAMCLQFLFMDDNAPCHRTVAAELLLESRRLAAGTLLPVTIRELRLALQDEWAAMPQQLIDTLILSMSRHCETCLAVREIISPTKDRMFLAGHPSQGCFGLQSHFALHATFSIKLLFIPLISLLFTCRNCGGGDRARVAIYHPFGEFHRAKIARSPVWCSRPTTGVPLAHATMHFVGLDLTTSDRWHQKTTTTFLNQNVHMRL
ncbi:transposable element Tcb2 transposase [Trichonephila clavipes]|nr:transposable element Tcb2 transposase [Trichonephila clavipes]